MRDPKRLARLHHVRGVQLKLAERDEADARDKAASQALLHDRIASLAAAVAPAADAAPGFSLAAAAHYRERLHQSALASEHRLSAAEQAAARATERTRTARRDETAAGKLLERAEADALLKAARSLEAHAPGRRARHDPC